LAGLAAAEVGFVDPQAPAPPDLTDRPDRPVAAITTPLRRLIARLTLRTLQWSWN
jgi:hypothetical protein